MLDGDVALNGGALGAAAEGAATVEAAEQHAEGPVHDDFNDGVVNVEDHRGDDNVTDAAEPG